MFQICKVSTCRILPGRTLPTKKISSKACETSVTLHLRSVWLPCCLQCVYRDHVGMFDRQLPCSDPINVMPFVGCFQSTDKLHTDRLTQHTTITRMIVSTTRPDTPATVGTSQLEDSREDHPSSRN